MIADIAEMPRVLALIVLMSVLSACDEGSIFQECGYEVFDTVPLEDGYNIEIWGGSCGATTGFSTHIVVKRASSPTAQIPEESNVVIDAHPEDVVVLNDQNGLIEIHLRDPGGRFFRCFPAPPESGLRLACVYAPETTGQ